MTPQIAQRYKFLGRHVFYDSCYMSTELLTAMLEDYARPCIQCPLPTYTLMPKVTLSFKRADHSTPASRDAVACLACIRQGLLIEFYPLRNITRVQKKCSEHTITNEQLLIQK